MNTDNERNGVDNAFLKAAVGLSRRGFLKKLGGFGLGAGASLIAGVGVARAQNCSIVANCVNTGTYSNGQSRLCDRQSCCGWVNNQWKCTTSFVNCTCGVC